MSILDDLRKLSSAEDFFETLGVERDPGVVRVARLHVLKRMGQYIAGAWLDGLPEEQVVAACKSHLAKAYDDFVASSPIEQRLFEAHQDAVKSKAKPEKPFVPRDLLIDADTRAL